MNMFTNRTNPRTTAATPKLASPSEGDRDQNEPVVQLGMGEAVDHQTTTTGIRNTEKEEGDRAQQQENGDLLRLLEPERSGEQRYPGELQEPRSNHPREKEIQCVARPGQASLKHPEPGEEVAHRLYECVARKLGLSPQRLEDHEVEEVVVVARDEARDSHRQCARDDYCRCDEPDSNVSELRDRPELSSGGYRG